jgi:hypothetical protein
MPDVVATTRLFVVGSWFGGLLCKHAGIVPWVAEGPTAQKACRGYPLSIIMGHETLGHGLENMTGGDTSQHRAIEIENDLRREQNLPERAQ